MMQQPSRHGSGQGCIFPPLPGGQTSDDEARIASVDWHDEMAATRNEINAAWCVLVHLYSDADEVCFGCQRSGDDGRAAFSVISYNIRGSDTLGEIVTALSNRDGALEGLSSFTVSWNTSTRFAAQHDDRSSADEQGDTAAALLMLPLLPRGVDLALDVFENHEGTISDYKMSYRLTLMSDDEAQNVAATFKHILALLHANPDHIMATLNPSEKDVDRIMAWHPYPGTGDFKQDARLVHEVFRQQVRSRPSWVAIDAWDGRMTYSELDEASDRLRDRLQQAGLGPGDGALLCFEKSVWMSVAMLAVLKTGAFCSNLDPDYPEHRVTQIAEATEAAFLVASRAQVMKLKGYEISQQLGLVEVPGNGGDQHDQDAGNYHAHYSTKQHQEQSWPSPDSTAFVVFTSGSTGVPKGIVVSHANVCTAVTALGDAFGVDGATRTVQFAAHSWDVSVQDYLGSLLRGATVCVPSDDERWNDLEGYMARTAVNWAHLTPTVARTLRPKETSKSLRTLLLVGEPMGDADIAGWVEAGTRVFNVYGCTEATWVQVSRPKNGAQVGRGHVSGYGINTRVWIVRRGDQALSPVNCTGEIWLEGPMVTQGYINVDPLLEQRSFPDRPEWAERLLGQTHVNGKHRYYRTGDLGRLCADGALEVMGRTDTQAKLGGQRLELSEVEHYLREASAFQAASVFIPKAGPFAGRLTAVLGDLPMGGSIEGRHNHHHLQLCKDEDEEEETLEPQLVRCSPPVAAEIAAKLGKTLPSFMVPVVWMNISRFPMTASGKLARSQILSKLETMADWASNSAEHGELTRYDEVDVLLPETPPGDSTPGEEAFLKHVCASFLGIEPASVDLGKSFVSLGGDSIRAMQIVARYRAVGKRITVGQLLNSRCLLEVAAQVEGLQGILADCGREYGTDQDQQRSEQQAVDLTGRSAVRQQLEDMGEALLSLPTINSLEDVEDVFPLSPMQDSLALSLARLGGRFYMDQFVWEVRTADGTRIDMDHLEQAWEAVVARHQALRTVFVEVGVEVDADVPERNIVGSSMPLYQVVLRRNPARCQRVRASSDDDLVHVVREHPRMLYNLNHHQLIHAGLPTHSMLMVYRDGHGNEDGHGRVWCRLEVSHLVEDAMSILPLLRDFSLAYRHSTEGPVAGPGIGSLTVSGEFVRYIRNQERHEASLAYWSSYLEGAQPCLFPSLVDSSRDSKSEHGSDDVSSDGRYQEQRVVQVAFNDDPRTHGLQQAVARLGLTLPTFFQTIWALVLHIYSGKTNVVFGNVASGRDVPIPDVEEAFGSFLGILVCRVDLGREQQKNDDDDGDNAGVETDESGSPRGPTILSIMKEIQRATIDGSSNQSCSLAEMQEAAGLFRDRSSRVPLFNSGISCRPLITERDQEDFALQFRQMENRELTEMDLALIVETGQDAMSVYLHYQPWFMSDAVAANVAETVSHLATEALINPRRSVHDVGKVSPRDLAQIWDWNRDCVPPEEMIMHSFVEERMRASPGRQAVCSWDGDMTYGELDRATGCVAQHLRDSCGVVPDSVVPICSEKSRWAVVAMLGVMRAGGCFVMLDPGHPDSRLLSIVEQVRPRVMLSSSSQKARLSRWARDLHLSKSKDDGLPSPIPVQVLAITEDWVKRRMTMTETPSLPICICPDVRPRHAMYVQFTSGTTGAPKGVVISHRNFATGFRRHCAATEVWPHTRALQFSAYSFDSSVGEILTTLAVGGCLCCPSDEDRSMAIVAFIARSGANWAAWTPSFASIIDPDDVPSLEAMCLAGEPLSASLVDRWADRVRMVNIYGPSECSMASTVNNPVTRDSLPSNIGRAHRSVTWIVDEDDHERLQPIGAVGELLIEGPVVADGGYLGLPDVTSRVFIGAPSWLRSGPHARPGARLYKTGDLVRYSSDGSINYVGRKDTQLKIHGQRVEVGDIEQHLRVCMAQIVQSGGGAVSPPPVAVELLHKQEEQQHGSEVLAAFIVVRDGDDAGESRNASSVSDGNKRQQDRDRRKPSLDLVASDPRALAGFRSLVERIRHSTLPLPSYMIPRIFVPLKTLPTTTAGKLDRRALHRLAADMGRQRLVSFSVQPEPGSEINNSSSNDAVITDVRVEEQQNPRDSEPSSVEDIVTGFVAKLLGLDTVGIHDDFFNLGGNSVLAIRLSGMARRHNLDLSVADIFEKPRIIDMVARIRAARDAALTTNMNFNGEDSHVTRKGSVHLQKAQQDVTPLPFQLLRKSSLLPADTSSSSSSLDEFVRGVAEECGMAVGEVEDVFPCTPLQENLMAISTRRTTTTTTKPQPYVAQQAFLLSDRVDAARLKAAWWATLSKHGLLRSRIVSTPRGGVLVMSKKPDPSQCTIHHHAGSLKSYLTEQQTQVRFDYGSPLVRVAFVYCSEDESGNKHRTTDRANGESRGNIVFRAHHSIYDGWSLQLIWDEVASVYSQQPQSHTSINRNIIKIDTDKATSSPPFQSFVSWIQQAAGKESQTFWRETLADADEEDSSTLFPAVPAGHQILARAKLTRVLFRRPQIPRHSDSSVTVPTLIQAAWALVLALYGGTTAVTFGAVLSGRDTPMPGIEQLVGPTMATVPRHFRVRRDQSIADFLSRAHRTGLASTAHQHLGLDAILRLGPGPRAACDFRSVVVVQPAEYSDSLSRAQARIGIRNVEDEEHNPAADDAFHPYPLNVEFSLLQDGRVAVEVRFDPDCVEEHRVDGMVRCFDSLCRGIGQSGPEDTLASIMTGLQDGPGSAVSSPSPFVPFTEHYSRMDDVITYRAAQRQDSPALVATGASLTYRELETRATRLARRLLASRHCLSPETDDDDRTGDNTKDRFVAICMPKSPLAVVAMLAIWKAGAAFTPLNTSHPPSRLTSIVSRAGATLILCSRSTSSVFDGVEGVEVWVLDEESPSLDDASVAEEDEDDDYYVLPHTAHANTSNNNKNNNNTSIHKPPHPDDAAYLLFTSGSTGEPKGVVVQHRALCSGMAAQAAAIRCTSETRMLQCANFAFDASVLEIFAPLSVGGCVCLPDDAERMADLAGFIRRHAVNACTFTPSLLRLLDPAGVPCLRTIVSGGEPLTRTDIEAWLGGLPRGEERRMYNVYGVTEACVVSAAMPMALSTSPRTVGYSVGASLWLVSPVSGMLAPPGAVGELFLEGPALARGYHKDEPRTRTFFVDDPAWLVDGISRHGPTRVYRTGDLMYRNGDGSLSFLGRRDGQVKIRGQRVEPDEVANMIRGWISSRRAASSTSLPLLPNAAVTSFRPADCLVAVIPSSQPLQCVDDDGEAAEENHTVYDVEGVACSLALHSALATSAGLSNKPGALHAGQQQQQQQRSALSLEAAELDAYLRHRIPEVIVPRAYIAVNSMPVTPSGKLDARWVHRCLETLAAKHGLLFRGSASTTSLSSTSTLDAAGSGTTITYHLSGDAKLLQECWAEVLRIHPATLIGEEADFFYMGGSSVTAIRLISLLRSRGRLVTYEAMVMHSQLGDMAATLTPLGEEQRLSQHNGVNEAHLGVPRPFEMLGGDGAKLESILDELMLQYGIDRARVYDVYPCTPIQEAFMAMSVMHQGAYISFQTLEIPAGQFTNFQAAWHSIHQRHEVLRTRIVPWLGGKDEANLQGPLPSPSTALQVVIAPEYETQDAYWRQAVDVDSFVRDVNKSHGYGERLVKLAWVMAEEEEGETEKTVQVIIAAHHAVYDGFSMAMLWQEVGVEMETLRKRTSSRTAGRVVDASVAPRRTPFSTYVRHLCLLNQTDRPMVFWRETLRGASDVKLFPIVSSPVSLSSSAPDSDLDPDPENRRPAASSTRSGTAVLGNNNSRTRFRLVDLAHAAWALTVSHYTANPDVVFGVISSGRESIAGLPDLDLAALAGPTMASAPLRLHVDYAWSTHDYLDYVRQKGLDLARFAHVGLQRISQASSDARRACRFESILVVQPASPSLSSSFSSEALAEDAVDVEKFLSGIKQVQTPAMYPHPLMVECVPLPPNDAGHREVRVNLGYDPRLVAHELAHRVLLTFTGILSRLARADAMSVPLCNLRGLSAEDEALLLERARRQTPKPVEACVHDLVRRQTDLHANDVAVDAWDGALTYAELTAASVRLASRLKDKFGDCHGRAFPMLCRKSKWAIVGMLAIWRAGGYLVPMEPTHPIQRLRLVARTVAASAVLVSSDCLSTGLDTGCPCIVIGDDDDGNGTGMQCVDMERCRSNPEEGETPDHDPNPTPTPTPTPSYLAYILFTSGSTGTPKGVMVEHRSLSSSLVALGSSHDMGPATRTMQFASYAFDAMLVEIWSTLVFGGCVCVPSDQQRMNDMTGFITTARVNHLFCTPSLSRTIPPDAVMPSPLQKVSLGGEAMSQGDVDRWCSRGAWLSNGYGPTEACIASTVQVMTPTTPIGTVGFPLDSCRLWVVNPLKQQQQQQHQHQHQKQHNPSQYELAPIGAIGELYIEGVNVARGYLHDDAKTAAAFLERPPWLDGRQIEDSSSTTPDGEKHYSVYRTGDLAYYNPDGSLRLVGRKDAQVKLRGQRVELGEIEEAIRQRVPPSITVAVRSFEIANHGDNKGKDDDDDDGARRFPGSVTKAHPQSSMLLAAFGVGSSPGDDDDAGERRETCVVESHDTLLAMREMISRLQQDLRAVLPTYMVPDGYVPLQSLPFNSSGKLDERALRECIGSLTPDLIASFSSTSSGFSSSSDASLPEDGPLSKHEALLAGLWMRLLSAYSTPEESSSSNNKNNTTRTTLKRGDDFFKLGGDSITAMRLVALARRYDLGLTWRDIVTNPTLSAMAGAMRVNTNTSDDELTLTETKHGAAADEWKTEAFKAVHDARCLPAGVDVVDVLPPTPVQENFMNATVSFPGAHVSSLVFTIDDPSFDVVRMQLAFDRCAAWFPILRTRLVRVCMPPRPRVGPASDDVGHGEMVQIVVAEPPAWTATSSGSLEEALEAEARTPPGLGQALSRFRVVLQQPDSGEDAYGGGRPTHLIWTQHHSSYDGWSVRLLLEHVVKAYVDEAYQPPLLSDHLAFSAFATHVRRLNRSAAARAFWSAYLEGARPWSLFNYDRVADPRRSQTMKRRLPLPAFETRPGSTVTTATYIVAAWAKVVGRLTSSPHDVTLGYTLSGRAGPLAGIEGTVGPVLNKIPLRIRVGDGDGVDEEEAAKLPAFSAVVEATQKALLLVSDRADCPRDLQGYVPENVKNLPLDLVVHPRGTSGGVDLLPGASIGLRASGARLAAPAPGTFSVEVAISDDGIEVVALWDERAVTNEVVDDTVDDFAALLVGGGGVAWEEA